MFQACVGTALPEGLVEDVSEDWAEIDDVVGP
jgi:hypothetical protein